MPSLLNSVALHQYFLKSFWTTWSFCFLARKEKTLEELGIGIPQKYCDFCSRTLQWSKHFSKGNHLKFGFPEHMKVVFVQSTQSWETPGTTATPCPSVSLGVCSNSCPLSQLGHQSHPLSSPSSPIFSLPWLQGLYQWVCSSHQVAKVLELQHQHQSFQWIFRVVFL